MVKEIVNELFFERQDIHWVIKESMTLYADPNLIRIVMTNLMDNAYKFTLNRENTVIEIGQTERDSKKWTFVKDNGLGFDMARMDYLFITFHRLNSNYPGTGIGLSLIKRIINRHQGEVMVEAEVDKGATFYFYI